MSPEAPAVTGGLAGDRAIEHGAERAPAQVCIWPEQDAL